MATRRRFVNVVKHVRSVRPDIADPKGAIERRALLVGDRIVTNPAALVPSDAPVVVRRVRPLRGEDKLRAALDAFGVDVTRRVCVDLGAAAGGFTRVLLERGAARVFAVDAGHGQLRGDLRTHSRVVCLERTNLGDLRGRVPRCRPIDVVTIDLSYLSIASALPQLEGQLTLAGDADLVALVKPMFELVLAAPPDDERTLKLALDHAIRGAARAGWRVTGTMPSPVTGARGAREFLLHARWASGARQSGRQSGPNESSSVARILPWTR